MLPEMMVLTTYLVAFSIGGFCWAIYLKKKRFVWRSEPRVPLKLRPVLIAFKSLFLMILLVFLGGPMFEIIVVNELPFYSWPFFVLSLYLFCLGVLEK